MKLRLLRRYAPKTGVSDEFQGSPPRRENNTANFKLSPQVFRIKAYNIKNAK